MLFKIPQKDWKVFWTNFEAKFVDKNFPKTTQSGQTDRHHHQETKTNQTRMCIAARNKNVKTEERSIRMGTEDNF